MALSKIKGTVIADNAINADLISDGTVIASDLLDNTITGAKLATDIAISTSGNITTTGALTSTGIDDNATSTAITIDSSQKVGIGTASPGVKLDLVDNTGSLSATNDITAQFTRADGTYNPKLRIRHSTTGSDISHSYSTTADKLTFSIGNSEAIRIYPDGKVGIGASSQAQQVAIVVNDSGTIITNGRQNLELSNINGTNGTYSRILFNDAPGGAGAGVLGFKLTDTASNYGQFEFWNSGSSGSGTRMVIDPNGNVGIGITAPDNKLHIQKGDASASSNANSNLTIESNSATNALQFLSPNTAAQQIRFGDPQDDGAGFINYSHASSFLSIGVNGPEKMRIDSSGNVGIQNTVASTINTANGVGDLVVGSGSGSGGITIYQPSVGGLAFADGTTGTSTYSGYINYIHATDQMGFRTQAIERMVIDSSGNVGIGTSSPSQKLDVKSQINVTNANNVSLQAVTGSRWGYSPSWRVVVLGGTGVGVNNNTAIGYDPSGNPNGSFSGDGRELLFRNGVEFTTPNSDDTAFHHDLIVLKDGNVGIVEASPQTTLHVDGTGVLFESMSIDTNLGNVTSSFSRQNTGLNYRQTEGLNVTTDSNASASLNRKSDGRILEFYKNDTLKGSISIDDNGISIGLGGTASSNVLDDYEEGIYTVALSDNLGNVTGITLNSLYNQLAYTKIGRLVHISGTIVITSFTGTWGSGTLQMTLPFTAADLQDQGGKTHMSVATYNVTFTAGTSPSIRAVEGTTTGSFEVSGSGITGGRCHPLNNAQLYIGGCYLTT